MSILKKLFGGWSKPAEPEAAPAEAYKGYTLRPAPYREGGQFQMCGVIAKEIDGVVKEHRFVRADRFPSQEEAAQFTLVKARQIVDLNGDRIFS